MPESSREPLELRKQTQREVAYANRRRQPEKQECSRAAIGNLNQLPSYQTAKTVMWYVDARSELRTRWALPGVIAEKQFIVVPYCTQDANGQPQLGLTRLRDLRELVEGKWRILEPLPELRSDPRRRVEPTELDFVVVPGVGFSPHGDRLGNGHGYYDRLLSQVRADCWLCGLCYECQLFDELASGPHDIRMHGVVTEAGIYP